MSAYPRRDDYRRRDSRAGKAAAAQGLQQVTRLPPYRPGMKAKLRIPLLLDNKMQPAGVEVEVKSLTFTISRLHPNGVWRVHLMDGRAIDWHDLEAIDGTG